MSGNLVVTLHSTKDNIIIKILHIFNILLMIAAPLVALYADKYYLILMTFIYVMVFEVALRVQNVICLQIFTVYMQVSGPVQMLLAEISPVSVFGPGMLLSKKYLLESAEMHWTYMFLQLGLYILVLLSFGIINYICSLGKHRRIVLFRTSIDTESFFVEGGFFKNIIIFGFAAFEYSLRINFNLDVPGKIPTIPLAGVIVYLYSFVHQYLAYLCLCDFYHKNKLKVSAFIVLICEYIVISIPDILLDRRAPLFFLLIIAFMHIYFTKTEEFKAYLNRRKLFFGGLVVGLLFMFKVFSEKVRYRDAVKLPITFFVSRIIGFADGINTIDYIKKVGLSNFSFFRIGEYFHNVTLNGAGSSMNYVYTHVILGYPKSAVHSNSLPLCVSSLMYSGFIGYVFFAVLFAIFFYIANRLIQNGLSSVKKESNINLYIGCYLSIYAVSLFMGGGAERLIEIFTLPIMFGIFSVFVGK